MRRQVEARKVIPYIVFYQQYTHQGMGFKGLGVDMLYGRWLELSFLVELSREGSEFDAYKEVADGTPNSKSSFTGRLGLLKFEFI